MFFFIILCIWCLFLATYTKSDIAQWYSVIRPTLGKWIRYFSSQINYEKWKQRRKLSGWEVLSLVGELGCPDSGDCLTKGRIKEQCETEYQTVADVVQLNAAKLGIDVSAYRSIDIFPPLVSQRIVDAMG